MWDQSETRFQVQFVCPKKDVVELETGGMISQFSKSKYSAVGKLWWLSLHKNVSKEGNVAFIGLFLRASSGGLKVAVRYTRRLVARHRSKNVQEGPHSARFGLDGTGWGTHEFVRFNTLTSDKSCFSCDDHFRFEVDVTVLAVDGIPIVHPPVVTFHEIENTVCSLSDFDSEFSNLFCKFPVCEESSDEFDGPVHDVVVVSKCGVEFACHGYILATNSVFRKIYLTKHTQVGQAGSKKWRIVIHEMSADVLRVVLSHIYHGSLKFDVSIAGDVLHAAETHDLPLLKRECEVIMAENLKVDNFLDYLMLAELTNSKKLKLACLSFWKNNGRRVMKINEWKTFLAEKDVKNLNLIDSLFEALL